MPIFRKARPAPATPAPIVAPPVDPLLGDAQARHFRAELAQGRWQEFHDFLEGTRDWDDRHTYLVQLSNFGRTGGGQSGPTGA